MEAAAKKPTPERAPRYPEELIVARFRPSHKTRDAENGENDM
jgi:hypothetical protein